MADERLRELERRWRRTGALEDEAAWLRERARAGDLPWERLRLAAYLGWPAAQVCCPEERPAAWLVGLGRFGDALAVRGLVLAAAADERLAAETRAWLGAVDALLAAGEAPSAEVALEGPEGPDAHMEAKVVRLALLRLAQRPRYLDAADPEAQRALEALRARFRSSDPSRFRYRCTLRAASPEGRPGEPAARWFHECTYQGTLTGRAIEQPLVPARDGWRPPDDARIPTLGAGVLELLSVEDETNERALERVRRVLVPWALGRPIAGMSALEASRDVTPAVSRQGLRTGWQRE